MYEDALGLLLCTSLDRPMTNGRSLSLPNWLVDRRLWQTSPNASSITPSAKPSTANMVYQPAWLPARIRRIG